MGLHKRPCSTDCTIICSEVRMTCRCAQISRWSDWTHHPGRHSDKLAGWKAQIQGIPALNYIDSAQVENEVQTYLSVSLCDQVVEYCTLSHVCAGTW